MSRGRFAAYYALVLAMQGLSMPAAASAGVAEELARCAAIAAPDSRLECFDRLAAAASSAARSAPAATPAPAPAFPPAPTTAPALAPAPAALPADGEKNFGFTAAQIYTAPQQPTAIQAQIARVIDDRAGHATVTLDNGQSWALLGAEDYTRLSPGDAVTIKRAALGSFVLATSAHHTYRVQRLR